MARSTYPIPTRDRTVYLAHDGSEHESESKARQHNAQLSIQEICMEGCYSGMNAADVAQFIISNISALAPCADDLNG